MMKKSSIWPQAFAAASASLIMLCSGYHYGWTSSIATKILSGEYSHMMITHSELSWILSFPIIGNVCGPILSLVLVEILGRRSTLLASTIPFIISCVLIGFARNAWWFCLARFLAGLGIGVSFMVSPMYICEIAESRIRGGLCALMPVMMYIGMLMALAIGPQVAMPALAIVGVVIPIVAATALLWTPETPYYYAMKRLPNQARKSLAWLRGTPDVHQEMEQIQNSMALNRRSGGNFLNLFTVVSNRKALLVSIGLFAARQLSGYAIILFSISDFVGLAGVSIGSNLPNILFLTQLVTSIFLVFLTDKVGRRSLLLASASLCALFLTVVAAYCHLLVTESYISGLSVLPLVGSVGFVISYSIGLETLPSVIAGELFPCEVKSFALAISTVCFFAIGFGESQLMMVKYHFDLHAYVLFYVFVACNAMSAVFIYFFVPETKGRSLSDIQIASQRHFKTQF